MIFLVKGTCTLGHRKIDKDGNVVEEVGARFTSNPEGGSVAVGVLDDDTMEPVGDAEIFGDFDPWGYLSCALELLSPIRAGNIPDFESIIKKMYLEYPGDGCPFTFYCDSIRCVDCIVHRWMEGAYEK